VPKASGCGSRKSRPGIGGRDAAASFSARLSEQFVPEAELIHHAGPWRGREDVAYATSEYVDWFTRRRLQGELGMLPPVEFETAAYSVAAAAVPLAASQ